MNKSVVSIACSMIPIDDLVLFMSWNLIRLEIKSLCSSFTLNKPEGMTHCFPRLHSYILHLQHTFENILMKVLFTSNILLQNGGNVRTPILWCNNCISEKRMNNQFRFKYSDNIVKFEGICYVLFFMTLDFQFILSIFTLTSLHESCDGR